jgi:ssDNA-binding Zn-finger/Zn-ribbon topoisomerase 1
MPHTTICPKCHTETQVDESVIGRFLTCENCRCLYYVVVPSLKDEKRPWQSIPASSAISAPRPTTPEETLEYRIGRLAVLMLINIVIGVAVLVVELIRLLK